MGRTKNNSCNALRLRRRPDILRYIAIVSTSNNIYICSTFRRLQKIYADSVDSISDFCVVDLKTEKVFPTDIINFMKFWKDNYIDYNAEYVEN